MIIVEDHIVTQRESDLESEVRRLRNELSDALIRELRLRDDLGEALVRENNLIAELADNGLEVKDA